MRTQLKLPFTVLSDTRLDAARKFGLIGHEKPGEPTPATLVLDSRSGVRLSTLNQWDKSLVARDVLDYTRALKQSDTPATIPEPQVEKPQPGFLFAKALWNIATGLIVR